MSKNIFINEMKIIVKIENALENKKKYSIQMEDSRKFWVSSYEILASSEVIVKSE